MTSQAEQAEEHFHQSAFKRFQARGVRRQFDPALPNVTFYRYDDGSAIRVDRDQPVGSSSSNIIDIQVF